MLSVDVRDWLAGVLHLDWGSVPDWVGGLGTVGTLLFGVLSLRREVRQRRREERAARARQARLVSTTPRIEGGGVLRVRVANDSPQPIFDLAVVAIVAKDVADRAGMALPVSAVTGPTDRLDAKGGAELFLTVDRSVDLTRYASTAVELAFTDQQGDRWRRQGRREPELDIGPETVADGSWLRRWRRRRPVSA